MKPNNRRIPLRVLIAFLAIIGAFPVHAATVQLTQASDPAGIVDQTSFPDTATVVTTGTAPASSVGYTFAYWAINGVRSEDSVGRAQNPATFTIYEPTTAIAHYVPTEQDSDSDGIPDAFELAFYGNLTQTASSDTDNDGFSLLDENLRGYHPRLKDALEEGGLARRRSGQMTVVLDPNYVTVTETSTPPGMNGTQTVVPKGSTITLSVLAESNSGYRFTGWLVNGVRIDDGQQNQPATLTANSDITVVARYVDETADTDGDGIPDWYEFFHFDGLTNNAGADGDGDSFSLMDEYLRGYQPNLKDPISEGGLSRRRSDTIAVNLAGFSTYRLQSDPAGFVDVVQTVSSGATVTTVDLWGAQASGYKFAYWDRDGVRQQDAYGTALGKLTFTVDADTVATAHYVSSTQDSNNNGVPDAYEYTYYSDLTQSGTSDTDGDGFSLSTEFARNYSPVLKDSVDEGGIARRRSNSVITIDLQPFERLQFALCQDVLTPVFSPDPNVVTGWHFGNNAAPALGDWDGDGDFDLLVCSTAGISVYENIGSRFSMNWIDRSSSFTGLQSLCAAINNPVAALADWNGDGREGIAIGGNTAVIQFIASNGNFGAVQPSVPTFTVDTGSTRALPTFADVDADGKTDLVVLLADGTVRLYKNTGNHSSPYDGGNFSDNILGASVPNATGISCVDVTGDGIVDVLVADNDGHIWEFDGLAGGGYFLESKVWAGSGKGFANGMAISVRDIDGDGDFDMVGGCANGALIALRDPCVGQPGGLVAFGGANSVLLNWNPDWQSRIKGYYVYRSTSSNDPWTRLTTMPDPAPQYLDSSVTAGTTYFYTVTGLTQAFYPGNTVATLIESPAAVLVSATTGQVSLAVRPAHGKAGKTVQILLAIDNPIGLSGAGLSLQCAYDPAKLTPIAQTVPAHPTVELTGLSRNVAVSDNGATASEVLSIAGVSGNIQPGCGKLFQLNFQVSAGVPTGSVLNVTITSASLRDASGNSVGVAIASGGTIDVGQNYIAGDVNGDGVVDISDKLALIQLILPHARPPTLQELAAGDLNGNGRLDERDLVLLKRLLEGLKP